MVSGEARGKGLTVCREAEGEMGETGSSYQKNAIGHRTEVLLNTSDHLKWQYDKPTHG